MVQSKLLGQIGNLRHIFADTDISKANLRLHHDGYSLIEAEQIHGNKVSWISNNEKKVIKDTDGLGTGKSGIMLSIKTADCLPIFIFDIKKNLIVALHAGWKGLYLGIINKAIETLKVQGGNSKDLVIAIGPHIKKCCYKVDKTRIDIYKAQIPENIKYYYRTNGEYFLDLEAIAVFQLTNKGINKENIDILSGCTCCSDKYFSYRRDGKKSGRMTNIIYLTDNWYEKN